MGRGRGEETARAKEIGEIKEWGGEGERERGSEGDSETEGARGERERRRK